jgi:DNA-binding GntR family transcriptional regulator
MTEKNQNDRVDAAHRALRLAILEQALAPGTKLPEDDIGRHFGMSRTLARAALSRLHAQGLVDLAHKRTATVAMPTVEEAREAFGMRVVLENEAIEQVIKRWSPEVERAVLDHVEQEDLANSRGDTRVSTRLAGEFHILLAQLSGNATLEKFLTELIYRCSLIIVAHSRPHSAECAINEHSGLITALRARDVGAAQRLMREHLLSVERRALIQSDAKTTVSLDTILTRYTG